MIHGLATGSLTESVVGNQSIRTACARLDIQFTGMLNMDASTPAGPGSLVGVGVPVDISSIGLEGAFERDIRP